MNKCTFSTEFPFNCGFKLEVKSGFPKEGKLKIVIEDVQGDDPRIQALTAVIRRTGDEKVRFTGTGKLEFEDQIWDLEGLTIQSVNLGEEVYSLTATELNIEFFWEYEKANKHENN